MRSRSLRPFPDFVVGKAERLIQRRNSAIDLLLGNDEWRGDHKMAHPGLNVHAVIHGMSCNFIDQHGPAVYLVLSRIKRLLVSWFLTNSTAQNKPIPRTSPIEGCFGF